MRSSAPNPNEAIATADIENDVAQAECGAVEDAIASSLKVLDEVG